MWYFASLKKIDNLNIHVLIAEPDSPHVNFCGRILRMLAFCGVSIVGKNTSSVIVAGRWLLALVADKNTAVSATKNANIEKTAQNKKNV